MSNRVENHCFKDHQAQTSEADGQTELGLRSASITSWLCNLNYAYVTNCKPRIIIIPTLYKVIEEIA